MATEKKVYGNTGSLFFEGSPTESGDTVYKSKDGKITVRFTKTDDMVVKNGDADADIIPAKSNDFGDYWMLTLAGQLYFVAQRKREDRSKYLLLKKAKERPAADTEAATPTSEGYGTRA